MGPLAGRVFEVTARGGFVQGLQYRERIELGDGKGIDDIPLTGAETFGLG
jgi:hypothetical protein